MVRIKRERERDLKEANDIWMLYQLHRCNFPLYLKNNANYVYKNIYINYIKTSLEEVQSVEKRQNKYHGDTIKDKVGTCSAILCLRTFSLSRILRATDSPVSQFLANFTFANVPSPIVLPTSYLPTRRFTFG